MSVNIMFKQINIKQTQTYTHAHKKLLPNSFSDYDCAGLHTEKCLGIDCD